MIRKQRATCLVFTGAVATALLANCGTAKDLQEVASGCDEFQEGSSAIANTDMDTNVKAFVQASVDLKAVASRIKVDVKTACVDICGRLGVQDTWSAHGDDDASISNEEGTGACDKAAVEIDRIMKESKATAHFALIVTEPRCTIDTDLQASCEAACKADPICTPGKIDVVSRCDPPELSVQCNGMCNVNAICEGTAEVAAECEGSCDATCKGACTGTCTTELGAVTENAVTCAGKCKGTCKGTCDGDCHVTTTTGVACGATATCRGGCTGTISEPKCETELHQLPPECHVDVNCEAGCSAQARSHMHCSEPKVVLAGDVTVSPRVAVLKAAVEANLPKLFLAAKTEGPVVLKAVQDLSASGTAVANRASKLGGKSLACAGTAAQVAASASVTMDVSVKGSSKVHGSCADNES
jgi:hypothetical protein